MSEREDQGKNLLRMLQAAQPAPAPPDARQGHLDEVNVSEYPSPYPVPATDVRSAAAGEQRYPDPASAAASDSPPFLLPRPGASATTPVRSAGANLGALHQQSPQLAPETAPLQRNRPHYEQHQQQDRFQHQQSRNQAEQQVTASPPTLFAQRSSSVAAEQERFLKNFLAIGSDNVNNTSSSSAGPGSVPFSPPPQRRQQQTAVLPQTPPPPAATPPRSPPPVTPSAGAEATKSHTGRARNSISNQGKGGGGRDGRGRGGRTPQHGGSGAREGRKGRGRGGGGGGGGGRGGQAAPVSSSKYAWSAFQNSPDPKSIPIPSLRHFNLDVSPGEESAGPEVGLSSLDWRESIQPPPQEQVQGSGSEGVAEYDASVAGGSLSTPPPAATRVARTDAAASNCKNRSSAKKAEEDIKRMLRLG